MKATEIKEITDWLGNPDRDIETGRKIAAKHIKNRVLLKTIDKHDGKAMRLLDYHLQRAIDKDAENKANEADRKYIAKLKKEVEPPVPKKEAAPVKEVEKPTTTKELTPDRISEMKKRAGELSLQAATAHGDMRKAKTDAERFELGATIVTLDNERRAIWNELEGKGATEPNPKRVPSDAEKLAEIIRKGSYKTTKDSLSRAKKTLKKAKEANDKKAIERAKKSVKKFTDELADIERLMGIGNGKAES